MTSFILLKSVELDLRHLDCLNVVEAVQIAPIFPEYL